MCRWKSSADDARRRLMTPSQTKSPSAPGAIEDQQQSGGPYGTLSLLWDFCRIFDWMHVLVVTWSGPVPARMHSDRVRRRAVGGDRIHALTWASLGSIASDD